MYGWQQAWGMSIVKRDCRPVDAHTITVKSELAKEDSSFLFPLQPMLVSFSLPRFRGSVDLKTLCSILAKLKFALV